MLNISYYPTLTQHILHTVEGVKYPVTADPWWAPARVDHVQWVQTSSDQSLHVYMTWYGYVTAFIDPIGSFNEVLQKSGMNWFRKFYYQFLCHADFAPPFKASWNLDTWHPDVSYLQTVLALCNPK